jgi:hypothetical protein
MHNLSLGKVLRRRSAPATIQSTKSSISDDEHLTSKLSQPVCLGHFKPKVGKPMATDQIEGVSTNIPVNVGITNNLLSGWI